ncbi:phytyl ester synthase 1, chloroplastic isoform X2 [Elaeis guineensis]|uniref:phytyl ester synthase 1, chloroplastic isoform X2 n=1 Tax=Elaeis guineensis var. tenera TaxID=51953 RepID=UPI003C6D69A6
MYPTLPSLGPPSRTAASLSLSVSLSIVQNLYFQHFPPPARISNLPQFSLLPFPSRPLSMLLSSAQLPFLPLRTPTPPFHSPKRCRLAAVCKNQVKHASSLELDRSLPGSGDSHAEKKAKGTRIKAGELSGRYDDGFGTKSMKDYFDMAKEIIKPDGGPPRWFCPVECGPSIKDAPLLFFLPGIDGTGMGLVLHQKSLGKIFEVWCLHIPVNDRTPFEGLVEFVERSVNSEHAMSTNTPIYIVGDSLGGCLALAVAARNPAVGIVLILVNPATSFARSRLQPLLPVLEALPSNLHITITYLLSLVMGDPVKMAMAGVSKELPLPQTLDELSKCLTSLLPILSDLADIIPRDTLLWKLKLLKSAAAYANSCLHAVEAEVLLLASGKDNLLPSGEEADRLWTSLKNCRVRYFKDNGHTLLLEDGINLLTIIKGACIYHHSGQHDYVTDYLPPTHSEYKKHIEQDYRWFLLATSPVMFSTLQDGRIVKGLAGIPDKGPVLFVGYHMLMALDVIPLFKAFWKEKNIIFHAMAHPLFFSEKFETSRREFCLLDFWNIFGALPITPSNMYRLFSRGSFVLLYPGGICEALHRKPEFVRMAARFGVTIVPFGVVGEDDVTKLVLDYNDQKNIPFIREWIEANSKEFTLRSDASGEVSEQKLYIPGVLPILPGRFYYLFGKPFETQGMDILKDRSKANAMYLQIQSEIENMLSYLKRKREEDPYRSILKRALHQAFWDSSAEVPTFEP